MPNFRARNCQTFSWKVFVHLKSISKLFECWCMKRFLTQGVSKKSNIRGRWAKIIDLLGGEINEPLQGNTFILFRRCGGPRTASRTTDATLECVFVEKALVLLIQNRGSLRLAPLSTPLLMHETFGWHVFFCPLEGVIVGAFILCWLPYFTLFMVVAYCHDGESGEQDCVNQTVFTSTIWFG